MTLREQVCCVASWSNPLPLGSSEGIIDRACRGDDGVPVISRALRRPLRVLGPLSGITPPITSRFAPGWFPPVPEHTYLFLFGEQNPCLSGSEYPVYRRSNALEMLDPHGKIAASTDQFISAIAGVGAQEKPNAVEGHVEVAE